MSNPSEAFKINPGEVLGWPSLKISYPTDPAKLAELLPPGIDPSDTSNVHLNIYLIPVPDEPEFGVVIDVDADYRGQKGQYCLGYGIDQESAIYISKDMNGQPKFPCEIDYYRIGESVKARCTHQGYTFLEYKGRTAGSLEMPEEEHDFQWWIKCSRAVGGAAPPVHAETSHTAVPRSNTPLWVAPSCPTGPRSRWTCHRASRRTPDKRREWPTSLACRVQAGRKSAVRNLTSCRTHAVRSSGRCVARKRWSCRPEMELVDTPHRAP